MWNQNTSIIDQAKEEWEQQTGQWTMVQTILQQMDPETSLLLPDGILEALDRACEPGEFGMCMGPVGAIRA